MIIILLYFNIDIRAWNLRGETVHSCSLAIKIFIFLFYTLVIIRCRKTSPRVVSSFICRRSKFVLKYKYNFNNNK